MIQRNTLEKVLAVYFILSTVLYVDLLVFGGTISAFIRNIPFIPFFFPDSLGFYLPVLVAVILLFRSPTSFRMAQWLRWIAALSGLVILAIPAFLELYNLLGLMLHWSGEYMTIAFYFIPVAIIVTPIFLVSSTCFFLTRWNSN